ncbi:MAG: tetratricopeptide repeat protein [Maribacter sp.]|uniref:tetratricopeptide repeat protein n=1 Tax=Maribacter sp. TaxID=1897614 RepID=UPI003298CDA2
MMDKEALLTNYFSNQLTQEERKMFDELLDSDAEFKARFDFEQNLQRAIKAEENQNVKAKLISFEKEIAREIPKSSLKKSYRSLAIAASITLLMGLAWIGYIDGTSNKYEELYAQNFQEYPNTVYAITRSGSEESLERNAFVAYESGDYDAAIEKFEQIPSEVKQPYIDFFLGQSYLNAGKNDQAKAYFRETIVKADNFVAESHWYLAMIALKEKDITEAESELKKLINGYDYNKEKAVALLKELD